MRVRPVILTFNKFYLPGYRAGGPIRTLANMVERLGEEFDFHIITLDRDAGDVVPYPGVAHDTWSQMGAAKVMYVSAASLRRVVGVVRECSPDLIYLNSFFDPTFAQRVLWARRLGRIGRTPVVIAPRGEFSEGALRLKWGKKMAYLHASSLLGLYRNLVWQASSGSERADIARNLSFVRSADIREAMDLAPTEDATTFDRHVRRSGEPLRVCFLSRISPMKNLDFALRSLVAVKSEISFTIYGPKENPAYWDECESLIAALPANVKVAYAGEVHPTEVKRCLAQHDMFFFPTRGENYGHVIHEALGAGLPVLISDQTPWFEVAGRGVGWVLSLDNEVEFARKIDEFAICDDARVEAVKGLARGFAVERAVAPEVIQANRQLLTSVINEAKR